MANRKITSVLRQQPKLTGQIGNTIIYVRPDLEDQQVDIVENGRYTIKANKGFDALNSVEVNADVKPTPPDKGMVITAYTESGYIDKIELYGTTTSSNMVNTSNITEAKIATGVTKLGDRTLSSRSYLTTVSIPSTVTDIGTSAFESCKVLEHLTLPDGLNTVGQSAFFQCRKLTLNALPSKWTYIQQGTFQYCESLAITKLDNVTRIDNVGFGSCTSLTQVSMPKIQTINNGAFSSCTNLKAVWIGSEVKSTLGKTAFNYCNNIIRMFIDLPRATVETFTNYQYSFMNNTAKTGIIVCNDDPGFITKEEFDAIDWSTYTE